jgi:hypothetical protein
MAAEATEFRVSFGFILLCSVGGDGWFVSNRVSLFGCLFFSGSGRQPPSIGDIWIGELCEY